jgi:hypothetical protein
MVFRLPGWVGGCVCACVGVGEGGEREVERDTGHEKCHWRPHKMYRYCYSRESWQAKRGIQFIHRSQNNTIDYLARHNSPSVICTSSTVYHSLPSYIFINQTYRQIGTHRDLHRDAIENIISIVKDVTNRSQVPIVRSRFRPISKQSNIGCGMATWPFTQIWKSSVHGLIGKGSDVTHCLANQRTTGAITRSGSGCDSCYTFPVTH